MMVTDMNLADRSAVLCTPLVL